MSCRRRLIFHSFTHHTPACSASKHYFQHHTLYAYFQLYTYFYFLLSIAARAMLFSFRFGAFRWPALCFAFTPSAAAFSLASFAPSPLFAAARPFIFSGDIRDADLFRLRHVCALAPAAIFHEKEVPRYDITYRLADFFTGSFEISPPGMSRWLAARRDDGWPSRGLYRQLPPSPRRGRRITYDISPLRHERLR